MVIKSIGRKDINFKQLIDYLHKDDGGGRESFTYLHNLPETTSEDLVAIEEAFKKNNQYRQQRKKGIGQYHEVISFHPKDTAVLAKHPEIVEDIARIYLELRAPDTLAIARPHFDKNHFHIHFMISPNELDKKKSIRLSKKEFHAVQKVMEKYQREYYPELQHSLVEYNEPEKEQQKGIRQHKEWQMLKRGNKTDKQDISSTIESILANVETKKDFLKALDDIGIQTYKYKNTLKGVKFNGRKYRFERLLKKESELQKKVERWKVQDLER